MRDPVQYLALIALLVIGATLLWQYAVQIALTAVVVAIGLDCLQLAKEGIDIGITVYVGDIACLVLLSAGTVVLLRKGRFPDGSSWPVFALFALLTVNLARGASEFGLKPAGNGARIHLAYFIVPSVAWILLRPITRVDPRRLASWLGVLGCTFTIFAVCRWTGALPVPQEVIEGNFREVVRVLPAEYAMVIGQSLLAIISLQLIQGVRFWRICLAAILAAATVALQHRSVWGSTFVGLMWLAARSLRSSEKRWLQLAGSTFIGLALALITLSLTGGIDRIVPLVRANLDETRQQESTWNWRVHGFYEATDQLFSSDAFEIIVGPPSGRGWESIAAGSASVNVHSRYVETLTYYGISGVVVLLIWLFTVARKVGGWVRPSPGEDPAMRVDTAFLQALLLSQLTYFVAYSGGIMQGTITPLIWLAAASRPVGVYKTVSVPQEPADSLTFGRV
jgi:hypothetical protein